MKTRMMATGLIVVIAAMVSLPLTVRGAGVADDDGVRSAIAVLESWIETRIAYNGVPAVTVGVVHDQETVWTKGFGYADPERRIPAEPSTIFRIASISKLFTSIAVMKLRDEGKLRLDDPITVHLPWYKIRNTFPDSPPVTIRHLLTHTSGLPREAAFPYWTDFEFPTREQIIDRLPGQETVYPSETRWKYSNLALALAGEIVAAVSGRPYEDYIRDNILAPLGMNDTFVAIDPAHERLAAGYTRNLPGGIRERRPFTDSKGLTPAANLSSTVEDFATFAKWQFRLRERGGTEILRASTLKEMQRPHWVMPDWTGGWGLGFAVWHTPERDTVGHGGHVGGYTTQFTISPKEKIGVFVMTSADDGDPSAITDMIMKLLAPAITKAAAPPETPAVFDPAWAQYTGLYRDSWSELRVLVYNGRLAILFPESKDPSKSMYTLAPVKGNTFQIEGEGYGDLGETVVFETDTRGNVMRLKIGENYAEPVKK